MANSVYDVGTIDVFGSDYELEEAFFACTQCTSMDKYNIVNFFNVAGTVNVYVHNEVIEEDETFVEIVLGAWDDTSLVLDIDANCIDSVFTNQKLKIVNPTTGQVEYVHVQTVDRVNNQITVFARGDFDTTAGTVTAGQTATVIGYERLRCNRNIECRYRNPGTPCPNSVSFLTAPCVSWCEDDLCVIFEDGQCVVNNEARVRRELDHQMNELMLNLNTALINSRFMNPNEDADNRSSMRGLYQEALEKGIVFSGSRDSGECTNECEDADGKPVPILDENGKPVEDADGNPVNKKCLDDDSIMDALSVVERKQGRVNVVFTNYATYNYLRKSSYVSRRIASCEEQCTARDNKIFIAQPGDVILETQLGDILVVWDSAIQEDYMIFANTANLYIAFFCPAGSPSLPGDAYVSRQDPRQPILTRDVELKVTTRYTNSCNELVLFYEYCLCKDCD